MTTADLGNRQLASFLALSMGLHAIALLAPRIEGPELPLPEPPVLVFEMVETAAETAAPVVPEPPPPPPPVAKQPPPPPPPDPVLKAAPKPKPTPKVPPVPKTVPTPKPAAAAAPQPTQAQRPLPPVANAPKVSAKAKARYEDVLYSWLVRHKEYPLLASRRGIEGRPVVTVRIDRKGHVVSSRVSSPSRYPMLDEAAVAMVRRADPFPAVPDDVAGDSYEFIAPVEYRLR